MAQKIQVLLLDDIDGDQAEETVSFGLDGTTYEIDLSSKNAAKLRESLATYVAHARRSGRGSSGRSVSKARGAARTDKEQTQAIREWARKQGLDIKPRGRIPASVLEAYNNAN